MTLDKNVILLKMKIMKMKTIALCILILIAVVSCQKEEMSTPVTNQVMLLSSVVLDGQPYYQYQYNDSGLVSDESGKFDYRKNHYNEKNQLVSSDYYWNKTILATDIKTIETSLSQGSFITSANGNKGGSINYEYDSDGLLSKATFSHPEAGSSEYSEFTYDELNRVASQLLYWNNVETGYIDYSYDIKGNLTKEVLYNLSASGAATVSTTTTYSYDNKVNPFRSFNGLSLPGINTNRNNILRETSSIALDTSEGGTDTQTTVNTYEYNMNGYPVSKNGNVTYIYKE